MEDLLTFDTALFLLATFAAALVAGLAGFAFGLVAAAVWLHILTPLQTAALIVAFGLIVQGIAVWKLRKAVQLQRLWPFLVGALVGVPVGVAILAWANPQVMRAGIGAFLILYSLYALTRPTVKAITGGGAAADIGVGVLNGFVGGATGLAGIIVTIWCGLRAWPKDIQRAVFQPTGVAVFAISAAWIGARGGFDGKTMKLFLLGLPILLVGTWFGLKLYGQLDEASFRKVVLVVLLASGVALVCLAGPRDTKASDGEALLDGHAPSSSISFVVETVRRDGARAQPSPLRSDLKQVTSEQRHRSCRDPECYILVPRAWLEDAFCRLLVSM